MQYLQRFPVHNKNNQVNVLKAITGKSNLIKAEISFKVTI